MERNREAHMLEQHLYLENVHRELRDIALGRPRHDRPEPRNGTRIGRRLRAIARPPARAAYVTAARVPNVTIRPASAADVRAITRLTEISERRVPSGLGGLVLVAQIESDVVAALPVQGGPLLSDLRRPTADVAQLLELRSEQIRAATTSDSI